MESPHKWQVLWTSDVSFVVSLNNTNAKHYYFSSHDHVHEMVLLLVVRVVLPYTDINWGSTILQTTKLQ